MSAATLDPALQEQLRALYPAVASLPQAAYDDLCGVLAWRRLAPGTVVFDARTPCVAFPMLLNGAIRVSKAAANGRELVLYRVLPGEACVLTSSCLLGRREYPARGVVEGEALLVALPRASFEQLVAEHAPFRTYVFELFAERLADMMALVEAVAFQQLDQRLAALLLGKGREIHATHQSLAAELGSVREIVTRLLRHFAEQGIVSLGRERIEILDPPALRRIASSER